MSFEGMRIALIGPVPPPAGGMANQTRQLAELLRAARAEVRLVPTNAPYRPAFVAGLRGVRAAFRLLPYLRELWQAAGRSDMLHVMANSGWSWHLYAAPAVWVAWVRGVPVLVNYRGGEAAAFLARSRQSVRWSMRRASALAVPSGFLEEVFARHGMRAEVLPNIVDLQLFRPRAEPRSSAPHLVVARNLEPIYGNETALHAFDQVRRRYPAATLTVAGSGPEEVRLRELAVGLGIAGAVRFSGRLDHGAMAELYREADLLLNPSRADNMPNSLLEAMASGVPVVSTDVGGIPFLVRHAETAMLVAPGDAEAMGEAALALLEDPRLRARISAAALEEVQRYTWTRVAPVLAGLYRRAAAGTRP